MFIKMDEILCLKYLISRIKLVVLITLCCFSAFSCKEDPVEIKPIEIQFQLTHVSKCTGCDGAIDVSVSGGIAPYSCLWSNKKTSQDIDSLNAGIYWLKISDTSEQERIDTFEVLEPKRETFIFSKTIQNVSSYGGSDGKIDISISGGIEPYSFHWSQGSIVEDVKDLSAGLYWVEIKDAVDSILIDSTVILQPELFKLSLKFSKNDISEYGENDGAVFTEVSGGIEPYQYFWSNGCTESEAYNLSKGMIYLSLTDALDSTIIDSIEIFEPLPDAIIINTDVIQPSETGANDGSIVAFCSGGYPPYSYQWSNGSNAEKINQLFAGAYDLTVLDSKDQMITATIVLVDSLKDIDGNAYSIVKIGNQTWMKENLKVTHAPDGAEITSYAYNNDETNVEKYGRLYTWDVMMNGSTMEKAQGVCPAGWYVPSDEEIRILEMELGMSEAEANMENTWRGINVGTKLIVGGSSGFDAMLSGRRDSNGSYRLLEDYEYTWTSTEFGNFAWRRCLRKSSNTVGRWNTFPKNYGFSVRCIKNE